MSLSNAAALLAFSLADASSADAPASRRIRKPAIRNLAGKRLVMGCSLPVPADGFVPKTLALMQPGVKHFHNVYRIPDQAQFCRVSFTHGQYRSAIAPNAVTSHAQNRKIPPCPHSTGKTWTGSNAAS